jgi:hypothetical protein
MPRIICNLVFYLACLFSITACRSTPQNDEISSPQQLNDGFEVASPSEVGIDSAQLEKLVQGIARDSYENIHSVLLLSR